MYESIYNPAMGYHPPRVPLTVQISGWGLYITGGSIDPGDYYSPLSCRCLKMYIIRGWVLIFPGLHWFTEPQVGFSTPWGVKSTWGTAVFVSGLSQL